MRKDITEVYIADWALEKNSLSKIRRQVFIEEQQVPEELEWDEFDVTSTHFLARYQGKFIACARLKADGQIGRMAVLTTYRNQGVGTRLLQFVIRNAHYAKYNNIYLHAQLNALHFYEKQGFVASGDVFYEANIAHREMFLNR